jgi:hypothetical protein
MERTMWTDQRLDDLARRMDSGFERVDRDIRDLRLLMVQLWGTTIVGILGTIATVLITNT